MYIFGEVSLSLSSTLSYSGHTHRLSLYVVCISHTSSVSPFAQNSVFSQCSSFIGLNVQVICMFFCQRRRRSNCSKSHLFNSVASSIQTLDTLRIDLTFSGSSIQRNIISLPVIRFVIIIGDLVISKYGSKSHAIITPTNSANIESLIVQKTLRTQSNLLPFSNVLMISF